MTYRNSKSQIPNPKQSPKFKFQKNVPGSFWSLGFGIFLGFGICGLEFAPVLAAEPALTYIDLVHRLSDLEHLAILPAPGEMFYQWSILYRACQYVAAVGNKFH